MKVSDALNCTDINRLDVEILLSYILQINRTKLHIMQNYELSEYQETSFRKFLKRRLNHEPIAYITKNKEFYGREFYITHDVLIPRPSTESLIDITKEFFISPIDNVQEVDTDIVCISKHFKKNSNIKIVVDIGTGSGCIAITLALEISEIKVIATDINIKALEVAKSNAKKYRLLNRIDFRIGSLMNPIKNLDKNFLIVSNLPYVPNSEKINDEAKHEPKTAIFAGDNGMDLLIPFIKSIKNNPNCCGFIIECKKDQATSLLK